MRQLLNYFQLGKLLVVHYFGRRRVIAVVTALVLLYGTRTAYKIIYSLSKKYQLSRRRSQKRRQCKQALTALANTLALQSKTTAEQRAEILNLSFTQLQAHLKDGKFTPSQVLEAYQEKALVAHEQTNCLVEPIKEAQAWAQELEAEDKTNLPLYGIPVSFKDPYGIQGYDCVIGCSNRIGHPIKEDSVLVKVLKQHGAVPFVKTNVPQTMVGYESSNPVFGLTTNPHNKGRSAGGSSGGEAALLACGGSVLGFGSDRGGSIRVPASFCGVYGFKPTPDRLSLKGTPPVTAGQTIARSCVGPMAHDVDSLVEAMRALLVPLMYSLDTRIPPVTFNEQAYNKDHPLKIGYYTYNGIFHAVPASERAVREAVEALQAQGHEVVEWSFVKYTERLLPLCLPILFGDGGKELVELVANDEIDPSIRLQYNLWATPIWIRKLLSFLLTKVNTNLSKTLKQSCGPGSVSAWWKLTTEIKDITEEVVEDWQSQELDAVITPGVACPALPHTLLGITSGVASYSVVYNMISFPVGTMPVTKVTSTDIELMTNYPTPDRSHRIVKESQIGSEGLPVGVEVVALPWQDELCLRVMKELEAALQH